MPSNTIRSAIDKQAGRQRVFVCLLLLPFVLFTLSAFTFIPNPSQTPGMASGTTLPLTLQMSALHPGYAADDGCLDVITLIPVSWSEMKIYFNVCALQHLNAIVASVGAGTAAIGLICAECAPIAAWIATILAGAIGGIDFLQYASQGCGGAFLDVNLFGGIKVEPACGIQASRP